MENSKATSKEETQIKMKFTTLSIDSIILKTSVFGECGKCDGKEWNTVCQVCKNTSRYVSNAYRSPCPSIVMLAPSIYEQFFQAGTVNYFFVIAAYTAMIEIIALYCDPNSAAPIADKDWNDQARTTRIAAQTALLVEVPDFTRLMKEAFEEKDRLKFIQGLEHKIFYGLAVMKESSIKPDTAIVDSKLSLDFTNRIKIAYELSLTRDLSLSVIECVDVRCGRDRTEQKRLVDDNWNKEYNILQY